MTSKKIQNSVQTAYGDCANTATISHDDNGQTRIHVQSELDGHKHEHSITVGAVDGNDVLVEMSEGDLKSLLQNHLNQVREKAASVLAARIKVKVLSGDLK